MAIPSSQQPDRRIWLTPPQLRIVLAECIAVRQPVCIHGAVGIGKTSVIRQTCESHSVSWQLESVARRDSVDYSGIPVPNLSTGETVWSTPRSLARANAGAALQGPTRPHVIFWDEYNRGTVQTQNASMNIILENTNGDYDLLPNVCHVLAVNDAADSSGVGAFTDAVKNRLLHVYGKTDFLTYRDWADGTDSLKALPPLTFRPSYRSTATGRLRPEAIAYLATHPDSLHRYDKHADAFPTPRSWEFVSNILNPNLPPEIEKAMIYGAIGPEEGSQFAAHLGLYRSLYGKGIDIGKILASPLTEPVPLDDVSALYAISNALSLTMTAQTATNALTYLGRLPTEFQTFAILGAIRRTGTREEEYRDSPLHGVSAVNAWKIAHIDLF